MNDWKLNPNEVRKTALSLGSCREVAVKTSSVISFLTGQDHQGNKETLAKVNIYCDTGTVAVCRVLEGQVRQTFRRNITSLDAVKRLLRNPPGLTSIDKDLVDVDKNNSNIVEREEKQGADGKLLSETSNIQNKMELADVGIAILVGEKQKVEQHLKSLEKDDEDAAEEVPELSGLEFQFSLSKDSMKQVERCLEDISKLEKRVTCVSTNGRATIFLYGNGGVSFTPNIPKPCLSKLKQFKNSKSSSVQGPRPCYAALGSRERFYIGFDNGTAEWKGPKAFDKCMRRVASSGKAARQNVQNITGNHGQPRSVSFGSTYDTFFVVHNDGSWEYQGRGIPTELEDKLADRLDRPDIVCVTLGPNGEWFLKADNGRMWWGGISSELDTLVQDLLESDRYLDFMCFGDDGSFFLSYD